MDIGVDPSDTPDKEQPRPAGSPMALWALWIAVVLLLGLLFWQMRVLRLFVRRTETIKSLLAAQRAEQPDALSYNRVP